jgi:hypothetical protein
VTEGGGGQKFLKYECHPLGLTATKRKLKNYPFLVTDKKILITHFDKLTPLFLTN